MLIVSLFGFKKGRCEQSSNYYFISQFSRCVRLNIEVAIIVYNVVCTQPLSNKDYPHAFLYSYHNNIRLIVLFIQLVYTSSTGHS